jgi:nucleoside-diphosphate-sugar epimerase
MTILLTGASGFVGRAVLKTALQRGLEIRPTYRSTNSSKEHLGAALVSELYRADWSHALQGINVVIHSAARTNIIRKDSSDPLAEYRRVNVEGTLNLALQAAAAGVKRFVFISSIKVNGEVTAPGRTFTSDDVPAPVDPYGQSKAEAEAQLKKVSEQTKMEVTIIRPPLIYGPGVKGNLANLIICLRRGLPLPLSGVTQNLRSLVGLDNLVDLILLCADHPKAANQIFLISDGEDISTTELLMKISNSLGRPARLFWLPGWLISFLTSLIGKKEISQRLLGSLQVDLKKTNELLDWKPSVSIDDGLTRALE